MDGRAAAMLVALCAFWYGYGRWDRLERAGQMSWLERRLKRPGQRRYTVAEVEAADCFRCGSPAGFQWQVCADGNTWRPLCYACDVELNRRTLEWMGHPEAHVLMLDYITKAG